MDPFSLTGPVIVEVVRALWVPVRERIGYVCHLQENIQKLTTAMDGVNARSKDLEVRVKGEEEQQCARRTYEVENWLRKVKEFDDRVIDVLREDREHHQMKCLCRWFPWNRRSTYKFGKKVYKMLNSVKEFEQRGEFAAVTRSLGCRRAIRMSVETTIGLNAMLSKVWKCLVEEEDAGIIGLFGMGGVGKTTLMKMINNELLNKAPHVDVIIWFTLSKQENMQSLQNLLNKRLSISDKDWEVRSQEEKAAKLYEILSNKKFVLLIDDVWKQLDLSKVGVPIPNLQNRSKVVFTTRSEQLCGQMAAHKSFKVQPLKSEQAWELFEEKVGRETLNSHPEILNFAKDVAKECDGLPLALVTVGRAMARRKQPRDWEHSLELLRSNPSEFAGMVDQVFNLLEFSYNSLNNFALQRCFLYCCSFPEDYNIPKDYLINMWIGEGLLGNNDDVCKARNEGEHFIESLKLACLLEDSHEDGEECVKVHDVIRDMASWIACDKGENNGKILVVECERELSSHMFFRWKKAERIGVFGSQIRTIGCAPPVTFQLKTLIVRGTEVRCLPTGFFSSMKALIVLDLSDNKNLEELSEEMGELTDLQYLNLSSTSIKELPHKLKELISLRCLILDEMDVLSKISTEFISSLLTLNLFSMWISRPDYAVNMCEIERGIVEALESAEQLSDVSIRVSTHDCILTLLNHPNLRKRVRRADICNSKDIKINLSSSNDNFCHLEELKIRNCTGFVKIEIMCETQQLPGHPMFSSLRHVDIRCCDAFTDLSWLMQAPKLQALSVSKCRGIDKIVSGKTGEAASLFSCLISLDLVHLPNLTRICDQPLPFPSLQRISVWNCPMLRKLPLDSNSAENTLCEIRGYRDWWDKLEWDNEVAKAVFKPKFIQLW